MEVRPGPYLMFHPGIHLMKLRQSLGKLNQDSQSRAYLPVADPRFATLQSEPRELEDVVIYHCYIVHTQTFLNRISAIFFLFCVREPRVCQCSVCLNSIVLNVLIRQVSISNLNFVHEIN